MPKWEGRNPQTRWLANRRTRKRLWMPEGAGGAWKNTGVSGRGESFHRHVALRWHFRRYLGSLHRTRSCDPRQQQQSSPCTPHSQSSCQLIRYQHTSRDSEIALGAQPCHEGGMRKKSAWFAFWAVDWNSLTDSTGASSSVPTPPRSNLDLVETQATFLFQSAVILF